MILDELLDSINDNTVVEIFDAETAERIGTYDGKDSLPEEYNDWNVTDIFTGMSGKTPTLCIAILNGTEI